MQFKLNKLITSISELDRLVIDRRFITYANANSCRIESKQEVPFFYMADGWPVAVYVSFLLKKRVKLMSFFRCRNFWVSLAKEKKVALIGYGKNDLNLIKKNSKKRGINFEFMRHGYLTDDEIIKTIMTQYKDIDIIFLGISQPRQEVILKSLKSIEGEVSIVCCGAFWLQELNIEKGISMVSSSMGITPILRFYHSPMELLKRTIVSLPYVFKNIKK